MASALLAANPGSVEVLFAIDSSHLEDPNSDRERNSHFVGLLAPVAITEDPGGDPDKGRVSASLYSWGKIFSWSGTIRQWQHMVFEVLVGATRAGILPED